jgi:hypothetical protein
MSRNRVEERAVAIYTYLRDHLNEPHDKPTLLKAVELRDSHTTTAAIKRAWDLAEADGLFFPVACPANGMTYCVTNDPSVVLDPALHLGSIATGVGVREDIHARFMQSRMSKMKPAERAIVNSMDKFEAAQREMRSAYADVLKAFVGSRRERRRSDDT